MDKQIQILLGNYKNIKSVNVDNFEKIELFNKTSHLTEYNINENISANDVFDSERENNQVYRIYGSIEYLSLLNYLKINYKYFEDFFSPQKTGSTKTIFNSFQFYLLKPSTNFTKMGTTTHYVRNFEVIANLNNIEIYPAGFSNNVYGEQRYAFSFNTDFDVSEYFDGFGIPVLELFLYAKYSPKYNGYTTPDTPVLETLKRTNWNVGSAPTKASVSSSSLNIGDIVYGDLLDFNINEYTYSSISNQTYYITTACKNKSGTKIVLQWKYNPFIPFRLRYLSNEVYTANTGDTSYDIVNSIPEYALALDDEGNNIWRDIMPQGYFDPLTDIGVDYPFLNGKRYLFTTNILSIVPDLDDTTTKNMFSKISYSKNVININIIPKDDIENIGKPCQ